MKKTLLITTVLVVLLAAACSSQSATPLPTPTTIPIYVYVSPTPIPQIATAIATEDAAQVTADPQTVELGRGRYVALACGSCHGDDGKGNGDKGPSLIDMTLNENDFVTYLRTGGKMGSAHQYASNKLSDKGAVNLYQYVVSLSS